MMRKFFPWATVAVLLLSLCVSHLVNSMALTNVNNNDDDGGARDRLKRQTRVQLPDDPEQVTVLDILVLLCDGLQDQVEVCSTVPTIAQRFGGDGIVGAASKGIASRKKRSYDDFFKYSFSSFDDFFKFPTPPPFPTPAPFNFGGHSNQGSIENITSPAQMKRSEVYQLSSNSSDYPVLAIAAELNNNRRLFRCILRLVTANDSPPPIAMDAFLSSSTAICPTEQQRLFNYFSIERNTTCFEIQNVEEPVVYRECLNASTSLCPQKEESKKSGWDFSYNPFGSSESSTTTTVNVTRCITQYEQASFYSFCPDLPAGSRIIRDRIIVPKACTPFLVPSNVTTFSGRHYW